MSIKIRTEGITELAQSFGSAPSWVPKLVNANMQQLGRRIAYLMKMQLKPHRYTGALEDSVTSEYDPRRQRLEIGPKAKRKGGWDAGLLLQRGTGPIPNLPFAPIKKWAAFRGLPAGPVWYKLKTEGADAHPFVDETIARGDVQVAITNTAQRIGMDLAAYSVQKIPMGKGEGLVVFGGTSMFGGGG